VCRRQINSTLYTCRFQDNTEASIWTFVFWSLDGNYGSKWGRKILTDKYSSRIHVSSVLQQTIFCRFFTHVFRLADGRWTRSPQMSFSRHLPDLWDFREQKCHGTTFAVCFQMCNLTAFSDTRLHHSQVGVIILQLKYWTQTQTTHGEHTLRDGQ